MQYHMCFCGVLPHDLHEKAPEEMPTKASAVCNVHVHFFHPYNPLLMLHRFNISIFIEYYVIVNNVSQANQSINNVP